MHMLDECMRQIIVDEVDAGLGVLHDLDEDELEKWDECAFIHLHGCNLEAVLLHKIENAVLHHVACLREDGETSAKWVYFVPKLPLV